ncbi:MAG: TGS domain-containing protein [Ardenticatenaceae bacterium]|nr:TGS domain-containing protein [Ardenticatenaceae bacterium]MCB9444454.1 TGS domain-containing protein [Ardenticatenaceae bacterium]
MPTNLPPEAANAEERYRAAQTIPEKVRTLEEFISLIPKHKGTDKLRADLRKRLSKLKESSQQKKGSSRQETPFHIDREGAGQVVIIGPPNTGKSALVTALTNASPEISAAPFSTWEPTPGMMEVGHVPVQLVDTPPLNREYMDPELMNLIRHADLLLLMVDLQTDPMQQIEDSVAILQEHRIAPGHLREQLANERILYFVPLLVLVNKFDDESLDEDFAICCQLLEGEWPLLPISAETGRNLDQLRQRIFEQLNVIRVYSKPPGKEPDPTAPFVLEKGSTVADFAGQVHKDFLENLKSARVWGRDVFDGQLVGRDHVLHDGDVVELRI